MWRDYEEDAILLGLDLHYFWTLTPNQWMKYIKVYNDKLDFERKQQDLLNYWLGSYVGIAVNNPKKYPKKPYTLTNQKLEDMDDDELEKQGRRNTIKMGGVIK